MDPPPPPPPRRPATPPRPIAATGRPSSPSPSPATNGPVPRQQPSFASFVLLAILYFFLSSPPPSSEASARRNMELALNRRLAEVEGLKMWVNGSLTKDDERFHVGVNGTQSWNETDIVVVEDDVAKLGQGLGGSAGLTGVKDWMREKQGEREDAHYLRNMTGFLKGRWSFRDTKTALVFPTNASNPSLSRRAPIPAEAGTNDTDLSNKTDSRLSDYERERGWFPWTSINSSTPARTAKQAKLALSLHEGWKEDVRENAGMIRGSMTFFTPESNELSFDVEGVHFLDNGSFYLQAWPDHMYLDTRSVLSLALDAPPQIPAKAVETHPFTPLDEGLRLVRRAEVDSTNSTLNSTNLNETNNKIVPAESPTWEQKRIGQVVIADLSRRVEKIKEILRTGNFPEVQTSGGGGGGAGGAGVISTIPNCAFAFYGLLSPLPKSYPSHLLAEYESSLLVPTGSSVPQPPTPSLSGYLISENCGLILEVEEEETLLGPIFWMRGRRYAWVTGIVMAIQTWLLAKQMDARQSPAAVSRISYYSILIQVSMDAYIFSTHLTLAIVTDNISSLPLLMPAFFACVSAVLFGMRYGTLVRLHSPPMPDRSASITPAATATPTTPAPTTATTITTTSTATPLGGNTTGPLLPVTMPTAPVTPRRRTPEERPEYIFMVLGGITAFLLVVMYVGWLPLILTFLFSYWIPQIHHNIQRGSARRGLRKRFIVGTTVCRLFLPLYIWGCPANVLFAETSPWVYLLAFYSLSQAVILCFQDLVGPRFFLPARYFPDEPRWNYHPSVPPIDIETPGKMPVCNICFERIDVPVGDDASDHPSHASQVDAAIEGIGRTLNRWSYMVPPCHHIAHTKCLESWLSIKLECPLCRRPLPPI